MPSRFSKKSKLKTEVDKIIACNNKEKQLIKNDQEDISMDKPQGKWAVNKEYDEFGNLINLTYIEFSNNQLESPIPTSICSGLPNLTNVYFQNNLFINFMKKYSLNYFLNISS